jgi:hypothetical protein
MKRYLVKTVSKATANNQSYCGETHTYIHGKDEYLLMADTRDKLVARDLMTPYFVKQYGYKRECNARRAHSYTHPENTEYWNSTAEIIAVEIWNDGKGGQYIKYV